MLTTVVWPAICVGVYNVLVGAGDDLRGGGLCHSDERLALILAEIGPCAFEPDSAACDGSQPKLDYVASVFFLDSANGPVG